jgi:fatty acid desaturase
MMHEAAHFRISKKLWLNDFLGNTFAAYPTLASTEWYRKHHTAHHKNTNTDQDPDWARKIHLPDWQYPQTPSRISKVMVHQLVVGGRDWLKLMAKITGFDKKKIAYLIFIPTAFIAIGLGPALALYWFVPLLTVFPLIQRVRSISEHFGLRYEHELNGTRDTLANPIERFLFLPHHVGFHLVHHLYPSVPQYNLPRMHSALMEYSVYRELSHSNDSLFLSRNSVLQDLIPPHEAAPSKSSSNKTAA